MIQSDPQLRADRPASPAPRRRRRRGWLLLLLGLIAALVMLIFLVVRTDAQLKAVRTTIDGFMQAGARNDLTAALAVYTRQKQDVRDEIDTLFAQRRHFQNYASQPDAQSVAIESSTSDGGRAWIRGSIGYPDSHRAPFEAEFVEEEGEWRIFYMTFLVN